MELCSVFICKNPIGLSVSSMILNLFLVDGSALKTWMSPCNQSSNAATVPTTHRESHVGTKNRNHWLASDPAVDVKCHGPMLCHISGCEVQAGRLSDIPKKSNYCDFFLPRNSSKKLPFIAQKNAQSAVTVVLFWACGSAKGW